MNYLVIFPSLSCFVLFIAGIILVTKRKLNPAYRILGICFFLLSGIEYAHVRLFLAASPINAIFWEQWVLRGILLTTFFWTTFSLMFLRDDWRVYLKKWSWYLVIQFLVIIAFFGLISHESVLSGVTRLLGGYGFSLGRTGHYLFIFLLISYIVILLNLENTFRSSRQSQKKRIRANITRISVIVASYLILTSLALLFSYIDTRFTIFASVIILFTVVFWLRALRKGVVADTRVRVGRQVLYTSATLTIVGIYFLIVGLLTKLFMVMGFNLHAFVSFLGAFLVFFIFLAIIFSPFIRRRLQLFVDRSFYKDTYDYRRQWTQVSEQIGTILNLDQLLVDVKSLIKEVMRVDSVNVLLFDKHDQQRRLPDSAFLDWLLRYGEPISTEELRHNQPALYELNKGFLDEAGAYAVSLLVAKQKLLGILIAGNKVNKEGFSTEDKAFLKIISRQVSISVLNAKLSEELIVSRQMDYFNKFSSFLIHDLKNCVSMLSMVVQNAAHNFENPKFQKATLTTISSTIGRMKNLMQKFSTLPKQLEFKKQPINLNTFIKEILDGLIASNITHIKIFTYFNCLPHIAVDTEYMRKVFINLLINALESMPREGNLIVRTNFEKGVHSSDKDYAHIAITDTGAGMSREFIQKKLFRPFQSSKRKGIGLGLYQCKTIVESHGGTIDVKSEEGKGTTFVVRLPTSAVSE